MFIHNQVILTHNIYTKMIINNKLLIIYVYFSFYRIGIVVLLLYYISGFTKHAVKLIDITEKKEDSKRVQREYFE